MVWIEIMNCFHVVGNVVLGFGGEVLVIVV